SSDLAELSRQVGRRGYDCAVVMVSSWKNARLVGKAGIPIRIGPLVKWYAPFFFNRTMRQRRSLGARHEAAYNVDLLSPLGVTAPRELPPPLVTARKEAVARAGSMLAETFGKPCARPLVIVHPGMGGSALNWPEALWARLTGLLGREKGLSVLVTGSEGELGMLERVAWAAAGESEERVKIKCGLPLEDYIALLSLASVVAAPSTGPLHLASALGKPVVGIYSPVPAHHPKRWGPLGLGAKKVFLPHVDCPGALRCVEKSCPHFPCMESIKPEKVLEQILVFLGGL
ncbi:MAG: glycosyltransferase family 9 protein, partial [Gemmatimonadota bacterium]|nr:glycosyltransferase family 9 protein [Gemmatimonadota bacterium]